MLAGPQSHRRAGGQPLTPPEELEEALVRLDTDVSGQMKTWE